MTRLEKMGLLLYLAGLAMFILGRPIISDIIWASAAMIIGASVFILAGKENK